MERETKRRGIPPRTKGEGAGRDPAPDTPPVPPLDSRGASGTGRYTRVAVLRVLRSVLVAMEVDAMDARNVLRSCDLGHVATLAKRPGDVEAKEAVLRAAETRFGRERGRDAVEQAAGDAKGVRLMAVQHLVDRLKGGTRDEEGTEDDRERRKEAWECLVELLADADDQVARTATDGVRENCRLAHEFPESKERIAAMAENETAVVRFRAMEVLSRLDAVRSLHLAVEEIGTERDVLTICSGLDAICTLARDDPLATITHCTRSIVKLLSQPDVDEAVHGHAVAASARLASLAVEAQSKESTCVQQEGHQQRSSRPVPYEQEHPMLLELAALIERALEHRDGTVALDATYVLAEPYAGAHLALDTRLVIAPRIAEVAMGSTGAWSSGPRMAALRALASICGCRREDHEIILTAEAEERLRGLVFETLQAEQTTLGRVMHSIVTCPNLETRGAAHELMGVLVLRPWAAVEISSHAPLMECISDPRSEAAKSICELRYATVKALLGSCRRITEANGGEHPILSPSIPMLEQSVRVGIYGSGVVLGQEEPGPQFQIATLRR